MTTMLTDTQKSELIRRNWMLEDVEEVPFIVEIGRFHGATAEFFGDDEAELRWNIAYHQSRGGVYDYGMANLKPNLGINIVASAMGCPFKVNDDADPWVTSLIREENASDVRRLFLPDPKNHPYYGRAWKRIEHFQERSPLPLRLVNVPSPLVTASLVWEYTSFIEATLLFPAEAHALLEKVTEATIAYVGEQLFRIRNLHTMGHEMWYIPRELGVRISDDTAALMSPDLYREFGVRYNNRISDAFGGIVVHSCGDLKNVLPVMMETRGLRGIDLTIPQNTHWEVIREHVAGRTALNLRHFFWDHGRDARVDLVQYTADLIEAFGRRGVFIQTSAPTVAEAERLGAALHRLLSA